MDIFLLLFPATVGLVSVIHMEYVDFVPELGCNFRVSVSNII